MQKIRILLGVVTTLAALSACSNPPANPGTDSGAMPSDSGTGGVDSATDAGHAATVDSATDGGSAGGSSCAMPINLNTMGTALAMGVGRTITTTNTTAPMAAMPDVTTACSDDGMGGSVAVHELVFQYTVQTGGHIVASTEDPGSTMGLDTIVWVLDACAATATELACNDDDATSLLSMATSDATVAAGTTVFIVVGGYGTATTSTGTIVVSVSELVPHAVGAVCDAANPYCAEGSSCLPDSATATTEHCFADGSEYGACRLTGAPCDSALTCTAATPTATAPGFCETPIAAGGACTPDFHFLCVAGNTCQYDDGSTTDGHCLADGSEYGACRLTAPFCDATLTCSVAAPTTDNTGTCQMPVAHGAACTMRHYLCVAGDSCVPDAAGTTMTCITDGTSGGYCRTADPACDGTLTCNPDTLICG